MSAPVHHLIDSAKCEVKEEIYAELVDLFLQVAPTISDSTTTSDVLRRLAAKLEEKI